MKIGFYPGCSLNGTSREYNESVKALAQVMGLELIELKDWNCCGATAAHSMSKQLSLALPTRVLALAEQQGFQEIVVPCASCYNRLSVAQYELLNNEVLKDEILTTVGMRYLGNVKILNVIQMIEKYMLDALKENDYKYPKTLDEYEKMIKSYLAAHPKTEDGLDMIGITMSASDWHWMITLGNPAGLIADASPDNGQWIIDDEYNVHYKHVTDEEKEYFKWLCRMYNEGILDPNFATQTDDDYIAKVASGRVVAITDAEWHYSQCEATLVADGKVDQTYVGLPVTLREDQVEKALLYQGTTVGWGIGITKSCEDPVRAIKFLDYLCSDEGQILYHWGIEGENYFLDDDGQPYRTDEEVAKAQSDPDYAKNTGIDNYTGFPIYGTGSYSEDGFPYTPTTKESVIANYNTAEKEGCEAMGFEMLTDMFAQPEEFDLLPYSALWAYQQPQELAEKQTILDEIAWPGLVKCVTGTEDEFDANWESMVQELTDNGLADAEEAMTEFLATKLVDVE